jgi:hypothetical protein
MTSERVDTICRNLNVLSEISDGDKLLTRGELIELDKWSPVQWLTRKVYGQGSELNLNIVEQNINEAEGLIYLFLQSENQIVNFKPQHDNGILLMASKLKNSQTINRLRSSIEAALKGLERLLQSYKDQSACRSRILNLISKGKNSLETINKLLSSVKNEQ